MSEIKTTHILGFSMPLSAAKKPTIKSISKLSGNINGGYKITIKGTNLLPKPTIYFGKIPAKYDIKKSTAESLIVTVPKVSKKGSVDLIVKINKVSTSKKQFTYKPLDKIDITSITSKIGLVTIKGINLLDVTKITIDNKKVDKIRNTGTLVTFDIPSSAKIGDVNVIVTNKIGSDLIIFTNPKIITDSPKITDIIPSSGSFNGGYEITINGNNFKNISSINFGSATSANYTVNNTYTSINVIVPHMDESDINVNDNIVELVVTSGIKTVIDSFTYII